jgi:outer membrane autotransporter protein
MPFAEGFPQPSLPAIQVQTWRLFMTIDAFSISDFPQGKDAAGSNPAGARPGHMKRWIGALLCSTALVALPSTAQAIDWTTNGSGDWSTGTNWSGSAVPTSTDDVVIGTSTAANVTVGLAVPGVADNLTIGDTGAGALNVVDTSLTLNTGAGGDLTLGNTNGVTGTLIVTGGSASVTADDIAIGANGLGLITLMDGGSLTADEITIGSAGTGTGQLSLISAPGSLNVNSITFASSGNSSQLFIGAISGSTSLGADLVSTSGNGVISRVGTGGDLIFNGGASQLSGFNGNLTSNGATLVIEGSNAGTIAANIQGPLIWRSSAATAELSGILSGGSSFTLDSATELTLSNGANTHGNVSIVDGRLIQGASGAFAANRSYILSGGVLDLNNFDLTASALLGTGGTVELGSATLTTSGTGNWTFDGVINGTGSFAMSSFGTQTLTGANTYSGGTTITNGTLIGNSTSLQGDIVNNAALTFDQASAGTYADIISGTGALTKTGAGTLTLTGANTYSGGTTVSAGILAGNTDSLQGDVTNNSILRFDQATAGTYAGIISGSGDFQKTGAGTLTLTGANTYTGDTDIAAGTLIGDTTSLQGNITNDAALVFDQASAGTYAGAISGTGALTKTGTGDLRLTGANTYAGGTTVSAGTLTGNTNSLQGNITNNATLTFAQAAAGTYAGVISGTGALSKTGSGALTLTGANTHSGGTTVSDGALYINGSIGDVLVNGGMLGGSGTLGALSVASGGTLAPGNSIGTLNVASTVFNSSSIYEVELDDGGNTAGTNNDLLDATGAVTINGGTVNVTPENGTDTGTTYTLGTIYTVITAAGGVTGAFDAITDNFAFLNFALSYDANNVFITSALADLCLVGFSANQCATADAIETLGSGTLFTAVTNLSNADAASAMDALSGEIHASGQAMLIEDSRFFQGMAGDRIRTSFGNVASGGSVRVASAGDDLPAMPAGDSGITLWGQAFGATGQRDGDGNAADMDRTLGGLLVGADTMVADDLRLGVLAGYSHSSFDADDRASSGSADSYHAGIYGGTQMGNLGLRFGGSYGWHEIDTSRSVIIPGFSDTLSANYNAQTAQVFGEAGYRIDAGDARLEPFANLAHIHVSTDGFTETGGPAALTVADSDSNTTFTTLGVRAETDVELGQAGAATLNGMLGWRHAFGDVTPDTTASFAGSSAFTVAGTPIDRNALVVDAGADMALDGDTTLGLSYSGQIGSDAQDHGFRAKLTVAF